MKTTQNKPTRFRSWITKYALTKGIIEANVEDCFDVAPDMVDDIDRAAGPTTYYHGNDWHRTQAAALDRAREMREAKIRSLHKQIAKLNAMWFVEVEE